MKAAPPEPGLADLLARSALGAAGGSMLRQLSRSLLHDGQAHATHACARSAPWGVSSLPRQGRTMCAWASAWLPQPLRQARFQPH